MKDGPLEWTQEFLESAKHIEATRGDEVRHMLDLAWGMAAAGVFLAAFFAKTATPPEGEPFLNPEELKRDLFVFLEAQFDGFMKDPNSGVKKS